MKKIKKNESGRSMVEMLGVLAIIGVLSVGGIAGYRMAMDKITLNKIFRLVDAMAVSVAVESNKGESSIYEGGYDSLGLAETFCDNYGSEFCEKEGNSESNFYLASGETGAHVWNSTNGISGIYWKMTRKDSLPAECFCQSDLILTLYNIKATTCEQLVDITSQRYADVLVGYGGYTTRSSARPLSDIKDKICRGNTRKYDDNAAIQLDLIFLGADGSNCAQCHNTVCPELCD